MLNETTLKRLAFIKYIYKNSVAQSHSPEPMCGASILLLHDSIELFLHLAAEHLDVAINRDTPFMKYWDLLSPKLPEGYPTHNSSMLRLNSSRVELKHRGTRPCKSDIEGFRVYATDFFKENTPPIFGIEFSDISLISLVKCEKARGNLDEATRLLQEDKRKDAINKIALAFSEILSEYEYGKLPDFSVSPFFIGEDLTIQRLGLLQLLNNRHLEDILRPIMDSVEAIQNAFRIMALGIDFRRYTRFRLLTPLIIQTSETEEIFQITGAEKEPSSFEDCRFCLDFVVETAIALQEFDLTIDND